MLLTDQVQLAMKGGANATMKILALVAALVAGADSISDMRLLRHGGMDRLFEQVRALDAGDVPTGVRQWTRSCSAITPWIWTSSRPCGSSRGGASVKRTGTW
jgi:hypothetical protein